MGGTEVGVWWERGGSWAKPTGPENAERDAGRTRKRRNPRHRVVSGEVGVVKQGALDENDAEPRRCRAKRDRASGAEP